MNVRTLYYNVNKNRSNEIFVSIYKILMKYDQGPRSLTCQNSISPLGNSSCHSPNIEPTPNHPLGDGVELLHAKLHEEGRGGHHEAVASEHRDVDHHLEHPHAAELNHLQGDQGQDGEHQASCE